MSASGSIPAGPVDDVTRALSTLELNQQYAAGNAAGGGYQQGQSAHPPRFNPPHPPPLQAPGMRNSGSGNVSQRKLALVTDFDERQAQMSQGTVQSAAAYVPSIGHAFSQPQNLTQSHQSQRQQERDDRPNRANRDRAMTASGGSSSWDQKDQQLVTGRSSNPNLHHLYQGQGNNGGGNIPNVPPIPAQYLNNNKTGQAPRMGATTPSGSQGGHQSRGAGQSSHSQNASMDGFITSPIDVPTLIATKGYNPVDFDTRPLFVCFRCFSFFCVAKAYHLLLFHLIYKLRHGTLSSNPTPKMTCTNLSSTKSGALPIRETNDWTRRSKKPQVGDQSTCSLALTQGT